MTQKPVGKAVDCNGFAIQLVELEFQTEQGPAKRTEFIVSHSQPGATYSVERGRFKRFDDATKWCNEQPAPKR